MFLTWALAGKAYPAIIQQYRVSPNEITAETPVHRQQHRGDPLGLRPGQDHQVSARGHHRPHRRRRQGQLGHHRQRAPLGTPAGSRHLLADPGDPPLLLVQRRRRRPLHHRRRVPPGADQRPGARPDPAAGAVPDLGQQAPHLHPRLRLRDQPGERGRRRRSPAPLGAATSRPRTDTDLKITRPEIYYGELGNEYVVVQDHQPRVRLSQGRHQRLRHLRRARAASPIGSKIRQAGLQLPLQTPEAPLLQLAHRRVADHVPPHHRGAGAGSGARSSRTTRTPTWCCATTARWSGCGTPTPPPTASPTPSRRATGSTTSATPSRWSSTPTTAG